MTSFDKLNTLSGIYGVWHFNNYLRVTYVTDGWLVVWDHRSSPPMRYDCKTDDHRGACVLASNKLKELAIPTAH